MKDYDTISYPKHFYCQLGCQPYLGLHGSLRRHDPVMGGSRNVQCHLFPNSPVIPTLHFLTKDIFHCELVGASHSLVAQRCANPTWSPEEDYHLEEESRKVKTCHLPSSHWLSRILLTLTATRRQALFLITQTHLNNFDLPHNNINTKWIVI